MKTVTLPRGLVHVLKWGLLMCVLCNEMCDPDHPCHCCRDDMDLEDECL